MLIRYFYDTGLSQASYLVGCQATGDALVVDPNRDIAQYIDAARAEGLRLTHVTETHIHADYVSGVVELVERTGARAYLSDEGGADWAYGFAAAIDAVMLGDGAEFRVGNIRLQARHTPGHTPEHISLIVTDTAGADAPMGVFTGDFIFVGDVGRPDLLERAAGIGGTMEKGARQLFRSLQQFRELPDWLQLWPGHGAGSACGKALGAVPSTTLGYEKRFNWAFGITDEDEFVETVLAGQPEPPAYFATMKRINRDGPRLLGGMPQPDQLPDGSLRGLLDDDATVIDLRRWSAFRKGFAPGTLSIPMNRSFATWAGSLVPYDGDVALITDGEGDGARDMARHAARELALIGLDRVIGYFEPSALAAAGGLAGIDDIEPADARALVDAGEAAMLDVRRPDEWQDAHVPGVPNVSLGTLPDRLDEVPADRPVIVHCKAGSRSAIAASLLAGRGQTVYNLAGGFDRWRAEGQPIETSDQPTS